MKTIAKILTVLLLLQAGCFVPYGNTNISDYAPLQKSYIPEKPTSVVMFFEGETIPFKYEKRGLIEVRGNREANINALLDRLQYQAYKNGADAIIQIKKGFTYRESGLLGDVLAEKQNKDYYESVIFNGIAVKIIFDSTYIKPMYAIPDTGFIKTVRTEDNKSVSEFKSGMLLSFIFTVGLVIYGLTAKTAQNK